jgi:hypothetical protein
MTERPKYGEVSSIRGVSGRPSEPKLGLTAGQKVAATVIVIMALAAVLAIAIPLVVALWRWAFSL